MLAAAMQGTRPRPVAAELGTGAKRFVQENVGAPIYSTAWDGDVGVVLSAAGAVEVTTAHCQGASGSGIGARPDHRQGRQVGPAGGEHH
jgi:hypothetical protein